MVEPTKAYTLTDTGAYKSAKAIGSRALTKVNVQEALQKELHKDSKHSKNTE